MWKRMTPWPRLRPSWRKRKRRWRLWKWTVRKAWKMTRSMKKSKLQTMRAKRQDTRKSGSAPKSHLEANRLRKMTILHGNWHKWRRWKWTKVMTNSTMTRSLPYLKKIARRFSRSCWMTPRSAHSRLGIRFWKTVFYSTMSGTRLYQTWQREKNVSTSGRATKLSSSRKRKLDRRNATRGYRTWPSSTDMQHRSCTGLSSAENTRKSLR